MEIYQNPDERDKTVPGKKGSLKLLSLPAAGLRFFGGATWLKAKGTGDDGIERDKMPYTPDFAFQAGFNWDFLKRLHLSGDYQHF
ncbi:MAG TPA: hypothetical protein VMG30_06325 [Acidobacteriota bacterium]|nr:hypothetical protein [Acidobacteriota bacterium]